MLQALCVGCIATSFSAFNVVYSYESDHLRYLKYWKHLVLLMDYNLVYC